MAPNKRFRHNQGGGRQPLQRMFDLRREREFRYYSENILRASKLDPKHHTSFIQQIVSRAARGDMADAKAFLRSKVVDETLIDEETEGHFLRLMDQFSRYR